MISACPYCDAAIANGDLLERVGGLATYSCPSCGRTISLTVSSRVPAQSVEVAITWAPNLRPHDALLRLQELVARIDLAVAPLDENVRNREPVRIEGVSPAQAHHVAQSARALGLCAVIEGGNE
jgi:hypothetical protein